MRCQLADLLGVRSQSGQECPSLLSLLLPTDITRMDHSKRVVTALPRSWSLPWTGSTTVLPFDKTIALFPKASTWSPLPLYGVSITKVCL